MKKFRVHYAGQPDDAVLLNAATPEEAAYLFFTNEPRERTVFVEAGGFFGEKMFSHADLVARYPDMPQILASFSGETGVTKDALEREHNLQQAPKEVYPSIDRFIQRLIITGILLLVYGAVSLYEFLRDN